MVAVLIVLATIASVKASPGTTVAIDPAEVKELETGASFTVDVTIAEASNIYGWQANVTFDPGVLSVASAAEGPFLKNVNETAWPNPSIDNTKGYVLISSSLMPPYAQYPQGVSGGGILANITFTVKSGGSSDLHFQAAGTKLRTFVAGVVVPIENYARADGRFVGTGGTGFPQIPLEILAGAIIAVVVVVVAVAYYLRRRKQ
jgi:hypothetical protein